jgi:hypothetical protein
MHSFCISSQHLATTFTVLENRAAFVRTKRPGKLFCHPLLPNLCNHIQGFCHCVLHLPTPFNVSATPFKLLHTSSASLWHCQRHFSHLPQKCHPVQYFCQHFPCSCHPLSYQRLSTCSIQYFCHLTQHFCNLFQPLCRLIQHFCYAYSAFSIPKRGSFRPAE